MTPNLYCKSTRAGPRAEASSALWSALAFFTPEASGCRPCTPQLIDFGTHAADIRNSYHLILVVYTPDDQLTHPV